MWKGHFSCLSRLSFMLPNPTNVHPAPPPLTATLGSNTSGRNQQPKKGPLSRIYRYTPVEYHHFL